MQLTDFGELFALNDLDMLEALWNIAIVIEERGIVFQNAAFHFEIVDAARKGVGERLEDKKGERLAVVVFALDTVAFSARLFVGDLAVLVRVGESISKKREQAGGADIVQARGHHHRKDFFADDGFADGRNQVVNGDRAFAKKLFHHFVVAFGDHFDQLFVSLPGLVSERGRNFFDRRFAVAARLVGVRLHSHQVDDAAKSFFRANGQLQGDHVAAKNLL